MTKRLRDFHKSAGATKCPLQTEANQMGRDAFRAGLKSVPALDNNLMALCRRANPTGEIGAGKTAELCAAWSRGWHSQNAIA